MPKADDDTTVADATDTSTNEETQETDLEEIEVDLKDIDSQDETEEAEEAKDEESDTEPSAEEESKEEEVAETEEESEEEASDAEITEKPSKEEQKRLNDLYAQRRIAEKQVRESEREKTQREYLQNADEDKLDVAQLQIDAYNNRVTFNENKLESGLDRAMANIDLFTKGSPEVKQELLRAVDDFEKMYVKYNELGDPIEVKGDVYQYLTERADSIRRLTDVGARQSSKDRNNAKTRTITTPSKTPKEAKTDPDLEAFAEEAAKP